MFGKRKQKRDDKDCVRCPNCKKLAPVGQLEFIVKYQYQFLTCPNCRTILNVTCFMNKAIRKEDIRA